MDALTKFYAPEGPERVGVILKTGEVLELKNHASDPMSASTISLVDLLTYEDAAAATWHTHPGGGANLSADDYDAFVNWPSLRHFIVGSDGVREYFVEKRRVINA